MAISCNRLTILFILGILVSISILDSASAYSLVVSADKLIYESNETLNLDGTVDASGAIAITASVYNASGSLAISSMANSSGDTPNKFLISVLIDSNYTPGDYFAIVTDGTDSVNISFKVVSELIFFEPHLVGNGQVLLINTSDDVTNPSDANYGELVNLSIAKKVHRGNISISGKQYYFALADPNQNGSFDTVYIDDDSVFQLYNSSEDITGESEKTRDSGEGIILNNIKYIIGYIEFQTGNKIILAPEVNTTRYSPNETVRFVVLSKNSDGTLLSDQSIKIRLLNSSGDEVDSKDGIIDGFGGFGVYTGNFTAPSKAGGYTISVNNSMGLEFFSVDVFDISGKITDLSNNPAYSFSPNPDVRITAVLRNPSGSPVSTATVNAVVAYPNGTIGTYALSGGNGTWSYDLSLDGAPTGRYSVRIVADALSNRQEFSTGFAIESVTLDIMPINIEFIDEGTEANVNSFAPGKNVTLMILLSNISSGGIFAKGPESAGFIDIDNKNTAQDECNSSVTIEKAEDDRGVSVLSSISYQVMNLTRFMVYAGIADGDKNGPPDNMMRQCMIVFSAPNRSGIYRVEAKVSTASGDAISGATFAVQRLYATANPVDFKGDDFWFYAPNTTIRIGIKVLDLSTRQDIPSANLIDAKIMELYKEWPNFADMMSSSYMPNESVSNGTISFVTPDSEGYFRLIFKFKINVSGTVQEGMGTGFFMLKKYFIWGEPICESQQGPCIFSPEQNITIKVNVVDISKGMLFGKGGELTCTGCDGLEVDIERLANNEVFKEMAKGTDYNVVKGSVINSTANVSITVSPSNRLSSGWYSADLILKDPANENNTYFGWAGFEIRNFWIETVPVNLENGSLRASWDRKASDVSSPIAFALIARDPKSPGNIMDITNVDVTGLKWMNSWPPVDIPFSYTKAQRTVNFEQGPGFWQPVSGIWVVNITSGVPKPGSYILNTKAYTSKGSDTGNFWFEAQSFFADVDYRGKETWPAIYAPDENITINVTAYNFDYSPHSLSNETKLKSFWDIRTGRPVKVNNTIQCTGNVCVIRANLSSLGSGEYDARIAIVDTQGNELEDGVHFVIQSMTIATPSIDTIWIGDSDTPNRELNVDNDRDWCDNERGLNEDQYSGGDVAKGLNDETTYGIGFPPNECPAEPGKVCMGGNSLNLTFESGAPAGSINGSAFCLLNNGSADYDNVNASCSGRIIYAVSNGSLLWFNLSNVLPENSGGFINMTGIAPNKTTDIVNTGNRIWTITNIENGFQYADNKLIQDCYPGDCNNIIMPEKNTSFPHKARKFCVNATDWVYFDNATYCPSGMQSVHIVSNTTHVWAGNTTNLSAAPPKSGGESLAGLFAGSENWKVLDIAIGGDGSANGNSVRIVPSWTYNIIDNNDIPPINVSTKYSRNMGNAFCIRPNGEWDWGNGTCEPGKSVVFVVSNTTHLWVNSIPDVTGIAPKANGDYFTAGGKNWSIVNAGYSENPQTFRIKNKDGVCGERDDPSCQGPSCQRIAYTMKTPSGHVNYTSFYFGYVSNLADRYPWLVDQYGQSFNNTRDVYIYHNTTSVWINTVPDMSGATSKAVGETATDPYGGVWKVKTINKNKVALVGQNVLAGTGAWINTTLSKSGTIKISPVNEEMLGGWDNAKGSWRGVDLDGNGNKNDTVYFALTDSASPGVYDRLFFATDSNFSKNYPQGINIAGNRTARTFGTGGKLTLLSISPNADRIILYSNKTGDWADLGELKFGNNIVIPIIINSPSGAPETANISIKTLKRETSFGPSEIIQLDMPYPNISCTGLCEISINVSSVSPSQTQSGRYSFEIIADKDGTQEGLEEWKWPNVQLRRFLVDSSIGDGGYIDDFRQLPVYRFDWENYGGAPNVWTEYISQINKTFDAVFSNSRGGSMPCPNFAKPADADQVAENWTLDVSYQSGYWLYINSGNESKVWIQYGDCNFTGITPKSTGDAVNITLNNQLYMLYILDINVTDGSSNGVVIGLDGVNSNIIMPVRNDSNNLVWSLMSLNLSGQRYNVLLANDTTDYPMCSMWNIQECAKKAWFSTSGNFSSAIGASMGMNITNDLYLARVGPGSWDGIIIANKSQLPNLPQLPVLDIRARDGTVPKFSVLNESVLKLDLNKDGQMNRTFYMVLFDDRDDGEQALTDNIVDDDLNITDSWWQNFNADPSSPEYKDFYSDESGNREFREGMPNSIWSGGVSFGENQESVSWENQPRWDILNFNGTDILLRKQKWQFGQNENITMIFKAYNFDQTPVANANVSVAYIIQFTPFGGRYINVTAPGAPQVVSVQNPTDNSGFAVLKVLNSTWARGDYMAVLAVKKPEGSETAYNWFKVD